MINKRIQVVREEEGSFHSCSPENNTEKAREECEGNRRFERGCRKRGKKIMKRKENKVVWRCDCLRITKKNMVDGGKEMRRRKMEEQKCNRVKKGGHEEEEQNRMVEESVEGEERET